MKHLIIVRHAKSSWAKFGQADFDRPLNERGMKDAPEMAKRLLKRNVMIDLFISSPAKRAITTCELFCKQNGLQQNIIVQADELYHAPPHIFYNVVEGLDDAFTTVALFAHNPGITDFVNSLETEVKIDNMPTCGVFEVRADVHYWKHFAAATKHFTYFDYPKKL